MYLGKNNTSKHEPVFMKQLIVKFISQDIANPNEFVLRMGECRLQWNTPTVVAPKPNTYWMH